VLGALLVSPADTEAASYPPEPSGFRPMPRQRLPFHSIMVASSNDHYVQLDRARTFAENWGSQLVEIGAHGHINGESGLGDWPEGLMLLRELALVD
jgi:predicted alpha/beta hydrolase family esterase